MDASALTPGPSPGLPGEGRTTTHPTQVSPTMPDSNPRNLRSVREIARREILFSLARVPNTARLIVCGSETKVYEIDASQANPTPREMANHGRYVTAVRLSGNTVISGGYDGRLIWWDLQNNRII